MDQCIKVALGRLRMSIDQFYDLTPREYNLAVQGYAQERDEQEQSMLITARLHAMMVLTPHMKKGSKIKPQDLIVFPWENKKPGVHRLKSGIKNPAIKNMMMKQAFN